MFISKTGTLISRSFVQSGQNAGSLVPTICGFPQEEEAGAAPRPRRLKASELPGCVPKRAAKPLVGPGGYSGVGAHRFWHPRAPRQHNGATDAATRARAPAQRARGKGTLPAAHHVPAETPRDGATHAATHARTCTRPPQNPASRPPLRPAPRPPRACHSDGGDTHGRAHAFRGRWPTPQPGESEFSAVPTATDRSRQYRSRSTLGLVFRVIKSISS